MTASFSDKRYWLRATLGKRHIDALRRRRPGHVSDENCAELEDGGLSPFEDLNQKKISEFVQRNVEKLPDNQRDAVRLFYLEERKLHEVAAMMDAPLNTVRAWIRRGRLLLRKCLVRSLDLLGAAPEPEGDRS